MHDVLVAGAGMTGLACALELRKAGRSVVVAERAERAGGVVGTVELEGWRFERGPNTIPASARTFRAIAGELGIADDLVVSNPAASNRYLFHRGRLRALPHGPGGLFTTTVLSPAAKLRAMSEPFRKFTPPDGDEPTLEEFVTERFGRAVARTLGGAFVRGVYGAEIGELGAGSAFPRLYDAASEHGGVIRGMKGLRRPPESTPPPGPETARGDLLSFGNGLEHFVAACSASLGDALRLDAAIERLEKTDEGWRAHLSNGEAVEARRVVFTIPAAPTAALLAPHAEDALDLSPLEKLTHADLTVAHLGLTDADLPPGFGFLVPPDERDGPRSLGVLFLSRIFDGRAPAGGSTVTAILRTPDVAGLDEDGIVQAAHADLARAIGEQDAGRVAVRHVERWSGVIPRYGVGHRARMSALAAATGTALPGIVLAGAYRDGVSVEDCLARGRRVAREVAETPQESRA